MSGPDKMRVCMCTASGGYDVMQVQEDHAKPKSPDAGQVSRDCQSRDDIFMISLDPLICHVL